MPRDDVGAQDSVGTTLNAVAAPRHPCPECGRETKEFHPEKVTEMIDDHAVERIIPRRICSNKACRHVIKILMN